MIYADLEMSCDDCGDTPPGRRPTEEEVEFVAQVAQDWRADLRLDGWRHVNFRDLCPGCAEFEEGDSDE